MKTVRRPLKKSILKGIGIFTLVLCVFLSVVQYFLLRATLYSQYENRISQVLKYAASAIDADDMAECIRTGIPSETYSRTRRELDLIKARTGVHYLYMVIPLDAEETDNIQNVMVAATPEEYEQERRGEISLPRLNELSGTDYSRNVARKYLDAYEKDGTSFFSNVTVYGNDYTGMTEIRDSAGKKVAALCADFQVDEIQSQVRGNLMDMLIVVVILGLLFATIFMVWADRRIVQPIRTLEEDVVRLAQKSHTSRNPDAMVYSPDKIQTGNEVESLAKAVGQLSLDMRDYVRNMVDQEKELMRLTNAVNRDPLTHVGNRNAFAQYAEDLQMKMTEGHIEYAVLLADVRGLRKINEEYGHDRGDMYLQKACRIICETFHHSPVFRMSGDKFAAILLGVDYINRKALTDEAQAVCFRSTSDEKTAPWEKAVVVFGMADYQEMKDRTVDSVVQRADQELRAAKAQMRND